MALPHNPALALLDTLGIASETHHHPPLFTVEDSQKLRGSIPGGHIKNLFVKDKASQFFLITAEESSPLDLKIMDKTIGAKGRVSFASAEQLMAHLGVEPGSVTPLALVNDKAGAVRFILEKKLLDFDAISSHPLTNIMTTTLKTADLLTYIAATGHEAVLLDLPYRSPERAAFT